MASALLLENSAGRHAARDRSRPKALTLFAAPKPFDGHIAVIQRNAILSWAALRPRPEILLLGDDRGIREAAAELGVRHVPDIPRNEHGTPLVPGMLQRAQELSSGSLFCYINADIILLDDFAGAVQRVAERFRRFLMVGRRTNLDVTEPVEFSDPSWQRILQGELAKRGAFEALNGIDYFVFTRDLWKSVPPFALGRTAWDNWLLYGARAEGAPVVDASAAVQVIHQNHGYNHHPGGAEGVWEGPEAQENRRLAGGKKYYFDIADANWRLEVNGLRRDLAPASIRRRLERLPVLYPTLGRVSRRAATVLRRVAVVRSLKETASG